MGGSCDGIRDELPNDQHYANCLTNTDSRVPGLSKRLPASMEQNARRRGNNAEANRKKMKRNGHIYYLRRLIFGGEAGSGRVAAVDLAREGGAHQTDFGDRTTLLPSNPKNGGMKHRWLTPSGKPCCATCRQHYSDYQRIRFLRMNDTVGWSRVQLTCTP